MLRCAWLAVIVALTGGCAVTEIVLSVRSDISVPDVMDVVTIEHRGPGGMMETEILTSSADFPLWLGLSVDDPTQRPIIEIRGVKRLEPSGVDTIVQRTLELTFVEGESKMLRIRLDEVCIDQCGDGVAGTCDPTIELPCPPGDENCQCVGGRVPVEDLVDWTGEP